MLLKNSIKYLIRKKSRSINLFLIISLVLFSLFLSLSLLTRIEKVRDNLYKMSNSSFSIEASSDDQIIKKDSIKDILKDPLLKEQVFYKSTLAKLIDYQVYNEGQMVKRDDLGDDLKNLINLKKISKTKNDTKFTSGVLKLTEGRDIKDDDINKAIIHKKLKDKNKLELGSKIKILNKETNKDTTYEIVGIFDGKDKEKFTGLSSDLTENTIITSINTKKEDSFDKISFYQDDKEILDKEYKKFKNLYKDRDDIRLNKDDKAYKSSLKSVESAGFLIKLIALAIILAALFILSLILILWQRERIAEIGIYLSLGFSKLEILLNFILELVELSLGSLMILIVLKNPLENILINRFDLLKTNPDIDLQGLGIFNSMNVLSISFGLTILIIIISVSLSSAFILRKKVKDILTQIS